MNNTTSYEALKNAVVLQAVKDYRRISKQLKKKKSKYLENELHTIESFFLSDFFDFYTDCDGAYVLRKLREERLNGNGKRITRYDRNKNE